jgi:nicotinate phosphoribosyltransferase
MPPSVPPPPLITSVLGLGLESFVTVRAAIALGIADARAAFELTLHPGEHHGFMVLAGVEPLVDALERLRTRVDELDWLESVGAIDGPARRKLAESRFVCDVDAVAEGSVVFGGEAVLVVEGPYWQAQLVGGLALAALTDSTLVATRFARLALASRGGVELVEQGSAAAHRLGGAPILARAAYIGGAAATTNALAARRYGIPVAEMKASADRIALARGTARVVPQPELDEPAALELREAKSASGEGRSARRRAPVPGDGAPGGASRASYDLASIDDGGSWSPRMRVGVDAASSSDPGRKLLVRYFDRDGSPVADVAHAMNERMLRVAGGRYVDRATGLPGKLAAASSEPLRTSMMRAGKRANPPEPPAALRERAEGSLEKLGEAHRRLASPVRYPVGVTPQLAALKAELLSSITPS